jgi:hypothetical protein
MQARELPGSEPVNRPKQKPLGFVRRNRTLRRKSIFPNRLDEGKPLQDRPTLRYGNKVWLIDQASNDVVLSLAMSKKRYSLPRAPGKRRVQNRSPAPKRVPGVSKER